jgi:hypothetical protein
VNTGEWSPFCTIPDGLTWPAAVGSQDGPTRGQAAGGRWRRSSRGLYVPAAVSDTVVEQRIVEQAARLPAGGAVTGWAALGLAGANYFDGLGEGGRSRLPVPLALGVEGTLKPAAGAVISREPLDAAEVRVLHDVPCTVPVRALFDEMRRGNARAAAVAMDMAAAARLIAIWQMTDYLAEHRCSIFTDATSARRTCSTPKPALSASTTARST